MLNFKVFILPLFLYHKSYGYSFSNDYYFTLKKLLKKHKKNYKNIYTTMGDWNSSYPLFFQKITQRGIRYLTLMRQKFLN